MQLATCLSHSSPFPLSRPASAPYPTFSPTWLPYLPAHSYSALVHRDGSKQYPERDMTRRERTAMSSEKVSPSFDKMCISSGAKEDWCGTSCQAIPAKCTCKSACWVKELDQECGMRCWNLKTFSLFCHECYKAIPLCLEIFSCINFLFDISIFT